MIEENKWEEVRKMNISGVSVSGAMTVAPASASAPRQTTSPRSQAAQDTAAASAQIVEQMIGEIQSQIDRMNVSLTFSTYGDRGENIAVVVANKETGKVIREIPSKEIQHLYAKMSELAGMILNGDA
jgi:flagellar protein FlaG